MKCYYIVKNIKIKGEHKKMEKINFYYLIYQKLLEKTADKLSRQKNLSQEDVRHIQQIKFFCEEMIDLNNFNTKNKGE